MLGTVVGSLRGWGNPSSLCRWVGGGKLRKGPKEREREARVKRESREEADMLAGTEMSPVAEASGDLPMTAAGTQQQGPGMQGLTLGGGVWISLGAMGVVERTLSWECHWNGV